MVKKIKKAPLVLADAQLSDDSDSGSDHSYDMKNADEEKRFLLEIELRNAVYSLLKHKQSTE